MADPDVTLAVGAALVEHFGQQPARASVSFVGLEPIEVLRFEPIPGELVYVSLGMSRQPMTAATASVLADVGPRAELAVHTRESARSADLWRQLAVLAAAPMVEGVVYVAGMTLDLGQPLATGSSCVGVVVETGPIESIPTPQGEVAFFQLQPATSTELGWARVHGSAALQQRWQRDNVDLLDLARRAVALD